MASADICSKRWIWQQYDYQVRTNTIAGPGAEAAIVRIKETGASVAISLDGQWPLLLSQSARSAKLAVAECCRNLATSGAVPVAAYQQSQLRPTPSALRLWRSSSKPLKALPKPVYSSKRPSPAATSACITKPSAKASIPLRHGNRSARSRPPRRSPFPSRNAGRAVMLVGGIGACNDLDFGGTEYAKTILKQLWGQPPALDMDYEKRVHDAIREILAEGLAESAHDLSDGGLAVALAECPLDPVASAPSSISIPTCALNSWPFTKPLRAF